MSTWRCKLRRGVGGARHRNPRHQTCQFVKPETMQLGLDLTQPHTMDGCVLSSFENDAMVSIVG